MTETLRGQFVVALDVLGVLWLLCDCPELS
jgi:hypothetical protein